MKNVLFPFLSDISYFIAYYSTKSYYTLTKTEGLR